MGSTVTAGSFSTESRISSLAIRAATTSRCTPFAEAPRPRTCRRPVADGMDPDGRLRVYDFHGLQLGCFADDAVAAALDARLGRFAQTDSGPCDVRFDYRRVGVGQPHPVPAPSEGTRPVYESAMGKVLYSDDADRMFISSVWPIRAACDPRSGETTISIAGAVDEHLWALSHPLLTIPLIETLKRRGRFSVHAAGVALGGKGLLIPG